MKKLTLTIPALLLVIGLLLSARTASAAVSPYSGKWGQTGEFFGVGMTLLQDGSNPLTDPEEFGIMIGSDKTSILDADTHIETILNQTNNWTFYYFDGSTTFTEFGLNEVSPGESYLLTIDGHEISVDGAAPVPIPTAVLLLGSGLVGLVGFRRRQGQ